MRTTNHRTASCNSGCIVVVKIQLKLHTPEYHVLTTPSNMHAQSTMVQLIIYHSTPRSIDDVYEWTTMMI